MARKNTKHAIQGVDVDAGLIAAEENLVIDVQFLIQGIMNEKGITRAELAQRMGISKARLTQIMRPEANPTFRTVARLIYALDERLTVSRESENKAVEHSCKIAQKSHWIEFSSLMEDGSGTERIIAKPGHAFYERIKVTRHIAISHDEVAMHVCNENNDDITLVEMPAVA